MSRRARLDAPPHGSARHRPPRPAPARHCSPAVGWSRPGRMPGWRSGWVLVLLTVPLLLVGIPAGAIAYAPRDTSPSPTATAEPAALQVVLEQLTPLVPKPDEVLTVSGRLANTTDATITDVSARLRLSPTPLVNRNEISDVLAGGTEREGVRVRDAQQDLASAIPPGGQVEFSLSVPLNDLGLRRTGVFVIGVEALGNNGAGLTRQGLARTFLPWFPDPTQYQPSALVWLWPIAGWPVRDAEGLLIGNRTPRELSPGGRLRTLVDIGATAGDTVTWVVDPEILQTAQAMSGGYRVRTKGTIATGDRTVQAADWLAAIRAATAGNGVLVQPYADPDVQALQGGGLDQQAVQAITTAPDLARSLLGRPVTGGFEWAPGGSLDQPTLDTIAAAGVHTVVLADTVLPPDPQVPFTPSGSAPLPTISGPMRAVLADTRLGDTVAMPQTSVSDVLTARQRFLAETALVTLELPGDPRTVVLAPPLRWNPDATLVRSLLTAVVDAPWITPAPLSALIAQGPSEVGRSRVVEPGPLEPPPLRPDYLAGLSGQLRLLADFGAIVDNPTGLTEPFAGALLRAGSAAWRAEPRSGDALLRTVAEELSTVRGKVRLLSRGNVTFTSERGVIPVTVVNELDRPVTVSLRLTGNPAVRFEPEAIQPLTIPPGRRPTVEVQARVVGAGPVDVDVVLTTAAGETYSAPVRIKVRSTAYVQAAAWVVGGAFAALAILVVVRLARQIRRGADGSRPEHEATDGPTADPDAAPDAAATPADGADL